MKEDLVEVQASEAVVGGAGGTDPSSLQKSLMHNWMPTMPKYVSVLPQVNILLLCWCYLFLISFFFFFCRWTPVRKHLEDWCCSLFSLFYVIDCDDPDFITCIFIT